MIENNVTEENNLEKISIKSLFFQARDILIILWKGKYIIVIVSLLFRKITLAELILFLRLLQKIH